MMLYGKSADGSDAKEFEGVCVNPNNPNEWYIKPFLEITRYLPMPKEWVCKGRHQYRQVTEQQDGLVTVKWVCQCGRSL